MVEYIVFFSLIAISLVFFIKYERKPKSGQTFVADSERFKAESPIERRLYDCLKARGEYIRTQVPCGRYSIDIALPVYHIAIECDGKAYHTSPQQKSPRQTEKCVSKGEWLEGLTVYGQTNL